MAIGTITSIAATGGDPAAPIFVDKVQFTGDSAYPTGGTLAFETALRAVLGRAVEIIDIMPNDCGVYLPQMVETPAEVDSTCTFPVADQDTKTITYKLDGGAEQTITLAGAHTAAAHFVASITAEAGIDSYVSGTDVRVRTTDGGAEKTLQITGGTANAVLLFPTTIASGSATKRLRVRDLSSAGAEVTAATDLSGTVFKFTVLSR